MPKEHTRQQPLHTWEPEFVVAKLQTQLHGALEFSAACAEFAPELEHLARALARRQRRMYRIARRQLLRRPVGL